MIEPETTSITVRASQPGQVSVVPAGIRWRAYCTCGELAERSRILKAAAIQDAQGHAVRAGCDLSWPLVVSHDGL